MRRNQSGFSWVEAAIVLVMVGLLLGGVLKWQEVLGGAKVKSLAVDFRNVQAYIRGYRDKFHALPGDDANVEAHLGAGAMMASTPAASFGVVCAPPPGRAGCVGNGVIDGAWNSTTASDESFLVWRHLRLAGLASGAAAVSDPAYLPANAAGGVIGVQSGTGNGLYAPIRDKNGNAIRGAFIVCSSGVPGKFARQLDSQMDDGYADSGLMLATPANGYRVGASAVPSTAMDDAAQYVVCLGVQ